MRHHCHLMLAAASRERLPIVMGQLDGVLSDGRQFLCGGELGMEDVAVGGCLIYAASSVPREELNLAVAPSILAYLNR
jgi:hypothetical protein